MCSYYRTISILVRLFLMGKILLSEKVYVPIPPIEKGMNEAAETLVERVYDCIRDNIHNCDVEDLRVELLMENSSITARYEKQLVGKREVFDSNSSTFDDRIKCQMVTVERELADELSLVSKHLYE